MQSVEAVSERILYRLSLNMEVRALAERLLERFAVTWATCQPAPRTHHAEPSGLYRHSIEVALKALEEFEGGIKMEQRPDGSVDSFRSSHNRPRWQYATFIAALCHDLGKLFELEVRGKGETWCPLDEPYAQFGRRTKTPIASWRPEREHGAHAKLSSFLMHHILSRADITFLGLPRFVHLASCLSDAHSGESASQLAQTVSRADQASVEKAQPAIAAQPDSKVGLFLQTLQELITNGAMGVNVPGAQVYVEGDKAAVVVPLAVSMARDHLSTKRIVLPPNINLYNLLHHARLVDADEDGRSVRTIKLQGKRSTISLSALILPTDKVVPKEIVPTLRATHFEITTEPAPETPAVAEEVRLLENKT